MTRKILPVLFIFVWLLAACQPASSTQAPPTEAPIPTTKPTNQATPASPASPPGCTVTSRNTQADLASESPIPEVSDADWIQGAPAAYVTIIEYGDFQ